MPNRRQLLLGVGAAGVAAVVGVASVNADSPAAAAPGTDDPLTMNYRGHAISVVTTGNMAMATIDGRQSVHLERSAKDKFHAHLMPFHEYPSARAAVLDIVDRAEQRLFIL